MPGLPYETQSLTATSNPPSGAICQTGTERFFEIVDPGLGIERLIELIESGYDFLEQFLSFV